MRAHRRACGLQAVVGCDGGVLLAAAVVDERADGLHRADLEPAIGHRRSGLETAHGLVELDHEVDRVVDGLAEHALARGFLTRLYSRNASLAAKRQMMGAAPILIDFLIVNLNRTRMINGMAEVIERVQAATKIASIARGMSGRRTIAEMMAARDRVRQITTARGRHY